MAYDRSWRVCNDGGGDGVCFARTTVTRQPCQKPIAAAEQGLMAYFTASLLSTRTRTRTRHAPRAQPGAPSSRTLSFVIQGLSWHRSWPPPEAQNRPLFIPQQQNKIKTRAGAGGPQDPAHTRSCLSMRGLSGLPPRAGSSLLRAGCTDASRRIFVKSCHTTRSRRCSVSFCFLRDSFWLF